MTMLVLVVAPRAYASGWSNTQLPWPPSADADLTNDLACVGGGDGVCGGSVSCTEAGACLAVGNSANASHIPLAAIWRGGKWLEIDPPRPSVDGAPDYTYVDSVSCSANGQCIAIGVYCDVCTNYSPLTELWNGTTWTIEPLPYTSAIPPTLSSVSCTYAGKCVALGSSGNVNGPEPAEPLAYEWNGTQWIARASTGLQANGDYDVWCLSANDCSALNIKLDGGIQRWNGTSWSAVTGAPTAAPVFDASCTWIGACTAVGGYIEPDEPFAARWSAGQWITESTPVPNPVVGGVLLDVSCPYSNDCTAVGAGSGTLAEHWNGQAWSIQTTPQPSTNSFVVPQLSSVSCTRLSVCMAVGNYVDSSGETEALAYLYTS